MSKSSKGGNPNWQKGVSGGHMWPKGTSGNPNGSSKNLKNTTNFGKTLRDMLLRKKVFRRPDGTLLDACELELIAKRVITELRTGAEFDVRLLEVVMNRVDGKVKEIVEMDAKLEVAHDIDAREVILSRLNKLLSTRAVAEADKESDRRGSISDTVPLGTVGSN